MRRALFLLLRLICYPALAVMLAAGLALGMVWVNGQCPPFDAIGVTCATGFSQASGGVVLMVLDLKRWRRSGAAPA